MMAGNRTEAALMSAAKSKKRPAKAKPKKSKPAPRSSAKAKPAKRTQPKPAKAAAAQAERPFRFTAADTVQIRFKGAKKPEAFRVDDMAEATMVAQDGQTSFFYLFRLVSNENQSPDGTDRWFWFFDAKPVGTPHPVFPALWKAAAEQTVEDFDAVDACSGKFSTRSVTSYDGSGACHIVKRVDKAGYRMRLDLNGKREFCDSIGMTIGKADVLSAES
jgi:hypothetical protein